MSSIRKNLETKKHSVNPEFRVVLIVVGVLLLLVIGWVAYNVINGSDSLVEARLKEVKSDIVIPPGCTETDEGYVSGIDNGQRYNVNYQCSKTLTPDEINSYLAKEYPKKGYRYVSSNITNATYKNGLIIDYYGETYNINAEPTSKISVNISENTGN